MPIFEFDCRSCHDRFELFVQTSTVLACPSCQGQDLEKRLSVFAVGKGGPAERAPAAAAAPRGCGSCGDPRGPGSCAK